MRELKEKFYDIVWYLRDKARNPKNVVIFSAGSGFVIGLALGYMGRL